MVEMDNEGFIDHVVHHFARCVERPGLFAGSRLCVLVVAGEQVLKNFAKQLWIKRNFFFPRGVLFYGELLACEHIDETMMIK